MLKGKEGGLHTPLLFFLNRQPESSALVLTVPGT